MKGFRTTRRRVLASIGATPVASVLAAGRTTREATFGAAEAFTVRTQPVLDVQLHVGVDAAAAARSDGMAAIVDGQADGPGWRSRVVAGHLEWRSDAVHHRVDLRLSYDLLDERGQRIHVADQAALPAAATATPVWDAPIHSRPELQPDGAAPEWLERSLLVGQIDAAAIGSGLVRLRLHRVV